MFRGWYDKHALPYILDCSCGRKPFRCQRQKIVPDARGDVLEIGIGTGLNIPFYNKAEVRRVVGVDIAQKMHPFALRRVDSAGLSVQYVSSRAEELPLADASFDSVVCTYTLCSIHNAASALVEIRRVLRPRGLLLFSEHGVAPDESVRRWQKGLQPILGRLPGGCNLSVDIPRLLESAGYDLSMQSGYIAGLEKFAAYHYWGQATVNM